MRFDLLLVLKHFAVQDGQLVRKLASGHCRPVRVVERGRLMSVLGGQKYFGPEVAYACHYRVVPMYPIAVVDGDPFNMTEDNLMPVRLKRLRYRCITAPGGFRHPLASDVFRTAGLCQADWVRLARRHYQLDKPYVRQLEDMAQGIKPEVPERAVVRRVYAARPSDRSAKPEAVAGRVWHWWEGEWLSLPEPVHCSDDWMVRARAVKADPLARFVYDPVGQRTLQVQSSC